MRILFAGTPPIAARVLSALLQTPHEVVAVFTQPDKPAGRGQKLHISAVKEMALAQNIPIHQPSTLKEEAVADLIAHYDADIMIVLAYGLLLPKNILELPRLGCINLHASLLPSWRGASPITQSILAGDVETGISIMQMDEGMDTGPILKTFSCIISEDETTETLTEKLAVLGAENIGKVLEALDLGALNAVAQNNNTATYAAKIHKEEALLDWTLPAIILERKIRAFFPWPVAYTHFADTPIRIWRAKIISKESIKDIPAGTIINKSKEGFDVATGEGVLRLIEIQLPGKSRITCAELFKTSHPLFQKQGAFY